MACTSPLNLSDTVGEQPKTIKVNRGIGGRAGLFAVAISEDEDIGPVDSGISLKKNLRQAFDSDEMPVLITFCEVPSLRGRRSQEAYKSVRALIRPLTWNEILARASLLLKRRATSLGNMVRFGDVCVDFSSMEVSRSSGEQIAMTAQEFKTLKFFVSNPGRAISRDELLNHAWGYENYPSTRTVDNHVLKLRQKLEIEPSRPRHFLTVHSVGYKFLP